MTFESRASVTLPGTRDVVFNELSTDAQVLSTLLLSPATASAKITKIEHVLLAQDMSYRVLSENDIAADEQPLKDSNAAGEVARRLHFEMIEKVSFLGMPISVTVVGTQIVSCSQHLHLYESSANNGFVKIRKVRRFLPESSSSSNQTETEMTRIEEHITGSTNRLMSGYVGRECRRAHVAHVNLYAKLLSNVPP